MSLDLFTIHHKRDNQLETFSRHFLPIQVGCTLSSVDLGIIRDDTNGTLSARNLNYCELTAFDEIALSSKASHIGVMHYRRIFVTPKPLRLFFREAKFRFRILKCQLGLKAVPVERYFKMRIRTPAKLEAEIRDLKRYLKTSTERYDIITPVAVKYHGQPLRTIYGRSHPVEHFDLFMDTLVELYPALRPIIAAQDTHATYYTYNMFIMRRDFFEQYWSMLSSTLYAIDSKIDLAKLDAYQARVFGFLAERFMVIFVRYMAATTDARCGELPVAQCELKV